MQEVTEVSIDEALAEVAHRRKMAKRHGETAEFTQLDKQLDRLLKLKFRQMQTVSQP